MQLCLFCQIIKGKYSAFKLFETDNIISFLDVYPGTKGHSLIVPKKHYENIWDTPIEEWEAILAATKKLATSLKQALHCDGIHVIQNNGESAGQSIFHLHVHLFPRWKNDKNLELWTPIKAKSDELRLVQTEIKNYLS